MGSNPHTFLQNNEIIRTKNIDELIEKKEIEHTSGKYSITSDGKLYSNVSNKYLKQYVTMKGYCGISIRPNGRKGKCITLKIHRLVAEAFIPNPDNKPFVNHIDGNKQNNNVSNLEWCTAKENTTHAIQHGLIKPLPRKTCGSHAMYRRGCRCVVCKAAQKIYRRSIYKKTGK